MSKRKASSQATRTFTNKRRRMGTMSTPRRGYRTVARTRGVYAAGEMKYFDQVKDLTTMNTSPTWTTAMFDPTTLNTLFCPTQGAGINQRIGKACKVHKIKINGAIQIAPQVNQVATDNSALIRIMLVQDLQTNSAQMTGTQLMTGTILPSAIVGLQSFQNIDNFGRFKVLKEKRMTIGNPAITWDGTNIEQQGLVIPFKMNIKFRKPVEVRFNSTNGGTIADIVDNSWHVVANLSSADLLCQITYNSRICYKE